MSTKTFYVFHGDDDLSIDEAVDKLRGGMGENGELNTSEFDAEQTTVPEVINAASSYPFLSDKRLVIVRGLLAHLTRKGAGETGKRGVEQLVNELPHLPDYARLAFVERGTLSDKDRIVQLAGSAPNGYIKQFATPKDSTDWIIKRARTAYAVEIDARAAAALAEVTAGDLRRADNELAKLTAYVHPSERIAEDDVAALTPYMAETNIFKMVDALAEGRGKQAMQMLHHLLDDTKNNDPFSIYGMIIRQFRNLLLAKEHLVGGGGTGSIAAAVGVAPFVAQNLARQVRGFSLPQLEQIYRTLLENDIRMKTGRIDPQLALDLMVATLSG